MILILISAACSLDASIKSTAPTIDQDVPTIESNLTSVNEIGPTKTITISSGYTIESSVSASLIKKTDSGYVIESNVR